jgi:hypothetical protein
MKSPLTLDPSNIPAGLTPQSFIGDIVVAYGFTTRENVDRALEIQRQENAALTDEDRAANKKARFTGEILVGEGFVTDEQVAFGLEVQKHLRAQS